MIKKILDRIKHKKTISQYHSLENGSMLILTFFVFLVASLITMSLWKLVTYRTKITLNHEQQLRAKLAAKSGIEDAILEIKQGHEWAENSDEISSEWIYVSDNTFYKSNSNPNSLVFFDYPVTFSVSIDESITDNTFTITSSASVKINDNSDRLFLSSYQAKVLKSFSGELLVLELAEI